VDGGIGKGGEGGGWWAELPSLKKFMTGTLRFLRRISG